MTETEHKTQVHRWLNKFPENAPLVVVPINNAYDDVLECLDSLLSHTPATPILALDDASPDSRIGNALEPLAKEHNFCYLRLPENGGFVKAINLAFEWGAPRDVVVVTSDVIAPPGWLERLKAAAYSRSTIATATPFSNHGDFLSVPYRNTPARNLARGMTVAQVDGRIGQSSLLLRPLIPTGLNYCCYYRRTVLDVVGQLDEAFSPGYGEDIDFAQRATAAGFSHVLADDVFVYHKAFGSFQNKAAREQLQKEHQELIKLRHPWFQQALDTAKKDTRSPFALALERARAALLGYRIAIDATALDGFTTGAQVLVIELVRALVSRFNHPEFAGPRPQLAVIIRDDVPEKVLLGVEELVDEVVRVGELEKLEQPRFDLIHRPYQVYSPEALSLLQRAATRFIVSHLDFINYSNPTYFNNADDWSYFQDLTKAVFASADGIAFISQDAVQDAAQNGLPVPEERTCVTYVGVDHQLHQAEAKAPVESARFAGQPFIMIIGHNLKHKNRAYALKIFKNLVEQYQWPGHLVFAGPNVIAGGSGGEEAFLRLSHPELRERLHYLGAVGEGEKQWLMQHAALVLYPSIAEGFGLVPFEAAALGKPALSTRSTSLGEVLGEEVAYLDLVDPEADTRTVWSLINDLTAAERQITLINARAVLFTWEGVAAKTTEFYERILKLLPRVQGINPGTGMPVYGGQKQNGNLAQEYQRLEKWANELSQRLVTIEKKPLYRLLSRFRLL